MAVHLRRVLSFSPELTFCEADIGIFVDAYCDTYLSSGIRVTPASVMLWHTGNAICELFTGGWAVELDDEKILHALDTATWWRDVIHSALPSAEVLADLPDDHALSWLDVDCFDLVAAANALLYLHRSPGDSLRGFEKLAAVTTKSLISQMYCVAGLTRIDAALLALRGGRAHSAVDAGMDSVRCYARAMSVLGLDCDGFDMHPSRKGAAVRHARSPKTKDRQFVFACWQDWQRQPNRYPTKAEFARDMLDKTEHLKSQKNIEDWAREWEKGKNLPLSDDETSITRDGR